MTLDPSMDMVESKITAIHDERRKLFTVSPERALARILDAENPAALVQAIPEQDLHMLVHDIGVDDALPVLALASHRQWEYLVDAEIWSRDRMQIEALAQWSGLLLGADPGRAITWLMEDQVELIELYLYGRIRIFLRDHDEDPSVFPEGSFTHDDTIYVHIPETPESNGPGQDADTPDTGLIRDIIDRMAAADHVRYMKIMLEISRMIPAELEEEMYRLRTVRMAERGFVPFEDAVGVYQHMPAEGFYDAPERTPHTDTEGRRWILPPALPAQAVDPQSVFGNTLARLSSTIPMEELEIEFAALCNRLGVADDLPVTSREDLETIVAKAVGYLGIALETLCGESGQIDPGRAADLLRTRSLIDVFRVGFGRVLELKWQAEQWKANSWFHGQGLPLTFWGESWLGVLGGLLIKRPQYFDNYRSGVIYRDFTSIAEVRETEKTLADVMAADRLLTLCRIDPAPVARSSRLTHQNLLLTAWARHRLNLPAPVSPLSPAELTEYFSWLWGGGPPPHTISDDRKSAFLDWVGERSAMPAAELADQYGLLLEALFREIEDEYAQVSVADLNPRYMQMLLVSPRS